MNLSRRDFLKCSGAAAAVVVGQSMISCATGQPVGVSAAGPAIPMGKRISLEECFALSPQAMAASSPMIQSGWDYLKKQIASIKNVDLRRLTEDIYADSTPGFARFDAASRHDIWEALTAMGYTKQTEDILFPPIPANIKQAAPYIAGPGSGYQSHHAYPGGLVTHVAGNVMITAAIVDTYINTYGYEVDRDMAVTAQLLHDLHKPYVFQWQTDVSSRPEPVLAGAGEHHVLSLAELLLRKAPADLVIAQACAHTHPGNAVEEAQIVGWLKAAAVIGGADPVQYGLLARDGSTLPLPRKQEGFICHLGDHDYVLTGPAVNWTLPVLSKIAAVDYGLSQNDLQGRPFNSLRNYVYSQYSAMRLEQDYAVGGEEAVRKAVHALIINA